MAIEYGISTGKGYHKKLELPATLAYITSSDLPIGSIIVSYNQGYTTGVNVLDVVQKTFYKCDRSGITPCLYMYEEEELLPTDKTTVYTYTGKFVLLGIMPDADFSEGQKTYYKLWQKVGETDE